MMADMPTVLKVCMTGAGSGGGPYARGSDLLFLILLF
jgi:hypothetical protein